MAAATATPTVANHPYGVDNTQRRQILDGTLAISASPATYVTNGLPVSFVNEKLKVVTATPAYVDFAGTGGYQYVYDYTHGTIRIFESTASAAAFTELSNGAAIPAAVSGDSIHFHAEFPRAL